MLAAPGATLRLLGALGGGRDPLQPLSVYRNGGQAEEYPENDFSSMPLEIVFKHLYKNELFRRSWGAKNTHGTEWEHLQAEFEARLERMTRQALREYLDAQEDLIGSRSRLSRSVMDQIELVQNRLVRQLNHMSALLLAAVILQQIQRGESGSQAMEQIVQLAGQIEDHLPEAKL